MITENDNWEVQADINRKVIKLLTNLNEEVALITKELVILHERLDEVDQTLNVCKKLGELKYGK